MLEKETTKARTRDWAAAQLGQYASSLFRGANRKIKFRRLLHLHQASLVAREIFDISVIWWYEQ